MYITTEKYWKEDIRYIFLVSKFYSRNNVWSNQKPFVLLDNSINSRSNTTFSTSEQYSRTETYIEFNKLSAH